MRTSVKTPYFTSYSSDSQSFRDDSPFFSKTLNGAGEKARSVVEGRFLYVSFSVQKLPWDATGLSMLNLFGESVPESATVTEWDAGEEVSVEIYDGIGTEK